MKLIVRLLLGRAFLALAFVFAFMMVLSTASAQTDIPSTVTTLSGYWTTIVTLAITVLAFVIGRKLVRKI